MTAKNRMLDGIRILDLTAVIMGPFATHILADLGADVIKIESGEGDLMRVFQPHLVPTVGGSFLNLNRNKRSVLLDLKSAPARRAFDALIAGADVLVHNLRDPVMRRLGFGYEHCRAIKQDIVYCACYGFSAEGPYAAKPAYDDLIQAGSGFAALAAPIHGEPAYAPAVVYDKVAGQAVANAILAGLFHRERTGEGQAIEVPMFETAIEFNLMELYGSAAFVPVRGRPGYARLMSKNRRPYKTRDGWACILPYSDANWRDFLAFIGRAELWDDPRMHRKITRDPLLDELYAMLMQEASKRSTAEWVAFCDDHNIPCMPVIDLADIEKDPHVEAVGLFSTQTHHHGGDYRSVRRPVTYSAAPFEIRHHAPVLGEHTEEVLRAAAVDEATIGEVLGGRTPRRSGPLLPQRDG